MLMDSLGISKLDLKSQNRMQILRLLRNNGPISRIDIAHTIHITKAAVTIITNEMIREGILIEIGEQAPTGKVSRGRKKILLDIHSTWRLVLGISLHGGWVDVGLCTLNGSIVEHHTAPLQPLLSSGMAGSITEIFHCDDQFILSIPDQLCNIRFKREIAPCMPRCPLPVYIYGTGLIHCTEMQDQTSAALSAVPSFDNKDTPIPEILLRHQLPGYTGEHSLRREWDKDLSVVFLRYFEFSCECVVPVSIQIRITAPSEQRTRILRKDILWIKFSSPSGV